jgi:DNA helicase-2/ATP-dependent DNA helicase PcrA
MRISPKNPGKVYHRWEGVTLTAFSEAYGRLNPEQKLAVDTIEGPVLVLAGPGTGKTQILSTRIAQILQVTDAQPHNVLALTFTNSGAKNMQQRLVSLIGAAGYGVKCATFHSFCEDVISSHGDVFPVLPSSLDRAAEVDRFEIIEDILRASDYPLLKSAHDPYANVKSILSLISNYKREGQDVGSLRVLAESEIALAESGELKKTAARERRKIAEKNLELLQIFSEYERLMRQRGLFDYDDIILWMRDAFRRDADLAAEYQERYQYFLIDEFQDTNQAQLQVVQALSAFWGDQANVFAVGDPNQSIYRFQGASLANTLSFLTIYPGAEVIVLRTGYRCGQPIYDAAAELIKNNHLVLDDQRLAGLYGPLLHHAGRSGDLRRHEAANTLAECLWIADRIAELKESGVPLDETAVLYRNHKHVRLLESVLEKAGLPYEIDDGASILDHPFIAQILKLLALLVQLGQADEAPSIVPVLQQPWFKLDPQDVLTVARAAQTARTGESPWAVLNDEQRLAALPLRDIAPLRRLRDNLVRWQHRDGQVPVAALVEEILREAGIFQLALSGELPLVNLNALTSWLRAVQDWSRQNPSGQLADWLERLERMRRHGLGIAENDLDLRRQSVRLSSVHKAKGQEWEHVFLLHAQDTYWGNRRAKNEIKPLPGTVPYAELDKPEHNEDERRLFYVALTRAKKSVTVCWSQRAAEGDRVKELQPTQFMAETAGAPWQDLPGLDPAAIRQRLSAYLLNRPSDWLSPEVDRDWIRSLLRGFSLSASALDAYEECPANFLFSRVIRLPFPPKSHMAVGSAVHAAMEFIYRRLGEGGLPPLEPVLKKIDAEIAKQPFPLAQLPVLAAEAKTLISDYYHSFAENFQPALEVEKSLGRTPPIVFEDLPLVGKIDRVDLISDVDRTVRVIDYKTAKPKSRETILGQNKEKNTYLRQLSFYALLAELDPTFPYKVTAGEIIFLRRKESGKYSSEAFEVLPERLDELKQQLRTVKAELDSLAFLERAPCGECEVCEHLGIVGSELEHWARLDDDFFTANPAAENTAAPTTPEPAGRSNSGRKPKKPRP